MVCLPPIQNFLVSMSKYYFVFFAAAAKNAGIVIATTGPRVNCYSYGALYFIVREVEPSHHHY
jgi:hypothetical protein